MMALLSGCKEYVEPGDSTILRFARHPGDPCPGCQVVGIRSAWHPTWKRVEQVAILVYGHLEIDGDGTKLGHSYYDILHVKAHRKTHPPSSSDVDRAKHLLRCSHWGSCPNLYTFSFNVWMLRQAEPDPIHSLFQGHEPFR